MTRQPGRAAITASTLMVGLAVMVMISAIASSQTAFLTDIFNRAFSSDILLMPQTIGAYGTNIGADGRLAERLRALPDVAVVGTLRPADTTSGKTSIIVLGIDPASYPQVAPLTFAEGTPDTAYPALSNGRTVIANQILATALGLKVGDSLPLQTAQGLQNYRVVAIGTDALNYKLSTIFISQANVAADFNRTDDVMLMLKLKPGANLNAARDAVTAVAADYPQFSVRVTAEYRENILAQLTTAIQGVFIVVGLIILVPAMLGLLNTLTINVLERTREIGMLRAVGSSRKQIRRMVTAEALLLGLFGAAIGVLAGVAMSYGFVYALAGSTGWALPYAFPILGIASALVLAILLALFASILPARNAARLEIIRALQYE